MICRMVTRDTILKFFFNGYAHGGETENICVWEREKKTLVVVRAK